MEFINGNLGDTRFRALGFGGLGFFRGKERIGPRVFDDVFYFIFFL